jgi:hypothetical protein
VPDQIKAGDATPGQKYTTRGQETVTAGELYMKEGVNYRRVIGAEGVHTDLPLGFMLFPADRTGGVAHLVGLPEAELRPMLAGLTPDQLDDLADEDGRTWVLDAVADLQLAAGGVNERPPLDIEGAAREMLTDAEAAGDARPTAYLAGYQGQTNGYIDGSIDAALWSMGRVELDKLVADGVVQAAPNTDADADADGANLDAAEAALLAKLAVDGWLGIERGSIERSGAMGLVIEGVAKWSDDEAGILLITDKGQSLIDNAHADLGGTLSCIFHGHHEGDTCPTCSANDSDDTQDTAPTWGSSVTGNDRLDIVKACSTPEEVKALRQATAEPPLQTVVAREFDRQLDSLKKVQDLVDNPGSMRPKTLTGKLRGMTEQTRTKNRPGLIKLIERLLLALDPPAPDVVDELASGLKTTIDGAAAVLDAVGAGDYDGDPSLQVDTGASDLIEATHDCDTAGCDGSGVDCCDGSTRAAHDDAGYVRLGAIGWSGDDDNSPLQRCDCPFAGTSSEHLWHLGWDSALEGMDAMMDGSPIESNPHRPGSPVAAAWAHGWTITSEQTSPKADELEPPVAPDPAPAPVQKEPAPEVGEVIDAEYELDDAPAWDQGNKPWPVQVAEASRACALEMIQEQEDTAELVEAWKEIECGSRDVGLQGEIERSWEALTGKPFTPDLVLVPVIPDQPEKSEPNPPLTAVEISIVEDAGRLEAEIYKLKQERITEEGFWKAENERLALELEQARAEVAETSRRAVIAEVQGRYKLPETHGIYKDGDIEVVLPVDKLIETMDTPAAGMTDLQKWLAAWPLRAVEARAQGLRLELNLNNDHPSKP